MSELQSPLAGAVAAGYVRVAEAGPVGMITIRARHDLPELAAALAMPLPGLRRRVAQDGRALLWMSPDELMLILPRDAVEEEVARLSGALSGVHALVADVSDARALFRLTGPRVREVLAKLTPADVTAMEIDEVRRSRLGQVAAAFWVVGDEEAEVIAFRSVARYVFDLLAHAARPGSEV